MIKEELLELANEGLKRNDLMHAEEYGRQALALDGSNALALYILGGVRYKRGQYDESKKYILKAIQHNPDIAFAYHILGRIYKGEHLFEKANRCFEKALSLDPSIAWAWSEHAELLAIKGDFGKAKACYARAQEIDPHYVDMYADVPLTRLIRQVSFGLSNICNYSYIHKKCPLHYQKEKVVLPSRVFHKVVEELAEAGYSGQFTFNLYNEPLIDPRLFSFIAYARKNCPDAILTLLTNGFFLNQTILDELTEAGLSLLRVSAYFNSEYERLLSLKSKILYNVIKTDDLDDRLLIYDEKTPKYNLSTPCLQPVMDFTINCTGNVILCCKDWKERYILGNLHNESIKDILSKRDVRNIYENLKHGRRCYDICMHCNWTLLK